MRSHSSAMCYLRALVLPSFTIAFTKTIMPVSYVVYLSKQEGDRKDLCETRL